MKFPLTALQETTCNDAVALGMPSEEGDVISQSGNSFWYTFTPELPWDV